MRDRRGPGRAPRCAAVLGSTVLWLTALAAIAPVAAPAPAPPSPAVDTTPAAVDEARSAPGVPEQPAPPDAGSQLVDCSRAADPIVLTASSHLDPSCTYTGGISIVASNVTLDCQGALVQGARTSGSRGIEVRTPASVTMTGDVVRNCRIDGFLNSFRATREGFRSLAAGHEYDAALSDVVLERSELSGSGGVGAYVDGYVSRVTLRDLVITGAGSTGIYLEAGSRDNVVVGNVVHDNGYRENGPEGQLTTIGGLQFRYWGTGREGIAIDGSYRNTVARNSFAGNAAGGVFLYTNCGEYVTSRPERWFERRFGADDNLIEANTFDGGTHGVWVGQRMGENTYPMECSDVPYVTGPLLSVTLDRAARNTVRANAFHDVTYGVRVEDDGTEVLGNTFTGPSGAYHAVVVGTRVRTGALGRPVAHTVVAGNVSDIAGNPDPFRWVHGFDDLTVTGNTAHGAPTGICEGVELPHLPFIFVLAVAYEPVGSPVTPPPPDLTYPTVGVLPPCPPSPTPRVEPGASTVVEGGSGSVSAQVPVVLSSPPDQTVTASWSTVVVAGAPGGQAEAGVDYVPVSGTVTFGPAQTSATVAVPVLGDLVDEGDEYVVVALSSPANATLGGFWGLGFVTIVDDDA